MHMKRSFRLSRISTSEQLEYNRIEILANGRKVHAHFPNVDTDSKIMPLIQEILISSYLNNINKNVSFAGQSSAA